MSADARITFRGESTPDGLRFHWLRHDSLLDDRIDELPWKAILAVAGLRRKYEDGNVHQFLEFYFEDGVYDLGDQRWEAGWHEVAEGIDRHLPIQIPHWRERLGTLHPELCYPVWKAEYANRKIVPGKRLLVFLRGSELPPMLVGECEQCGSRYEFVNFPSEFTT
jgi:hypothetical protein